jgi:hypothetical protein
MQERLKDILRGYRDIINGYELGIDLDEEKAQAIAITQILQLFQEECEKCKRD